jgi:predicted Zn finger-like uncharacterized protein
MIIQCQSCASKYFLPEERVPVNPLKVRCPKCRAVFMLAGKRERVMVAAEVVAAAPAPAAVERETLRESRREAVAARENVFAASVETARAVDVAPPVAEIPVVEMPVVETLVEAAPVEEPAVETPASEPAVVESGRVRAHAGTRARRAVARRPGSVRRAVPLVARRKVRRRPRKKIGESARLGYFVVQPRASRRGIA